MHSSNSIEDDYLGSGKRLWLSIRKHGRENHTREILEFLPTRLALKKREKEIVNEKFIEDENCMNLMTGGHGGWKTAKQKFVDKIHNDLVFLEHFSSTQSEANRTARRNGSRTDEHLKTYWVGKSPSKSHREAISKANSVSQTGSKNSQFGKVWIHHTEQKISRPVPKGEAEILCQEGWAKGRKKFC